MNYSQFQTYIQTLVVDQLPSANFVTIFPAAIQDAEDRIYRELDFLATRTVDSSVTFTPGTRQLSLPVSIIVVQGLAAISPAGSAPDAGTRNQLEIVSLDFIDSVWPSAAQSGLPQYVALKDNATIVVAATPDQAYKLETTGIFRPLALSASNTTTYISTQYPDLMIAATMVFLSGWQKNFGEQSDDPKMAMSWENLYQDRRRSTFEEEQRRKGQSEGWSQFQNVAPQTQPKRT